MVCTVLLVLGGAAAAQDAPVTARSILTPPETPWHRPATYTLVLEGPAAALPEVPEWRPAIEGLEVRAGAVTREALGEGMERATVSYVVDPIDNGAYTLPPIPVLDGEETKTLTPPLVLRVRDLNESEQAMAEQFEEIARPEAVAPEGLGAAAWAGIVLVAAAAAAGAWYLLLRRRGAATGLPPTPAWELARKRLDELLRRHPLDSGRYEAYYVDLSAILRYYLEDRFEAHAPELTTPELLQVVGETDLLDPEQQAFLADFLKHCDRVKFARYRPSAEEMAKGHEAVRVFVEETTPRGTAVAEDAA